MFTLNFQKSYPAKVQQLWQVNIYAGVVIETSYERHYTSFKCTFPTIYHDTRVAIKSKVVFFAPFQKRSTFSTPTKTITNLVEE